MGGQLWTSSITGYRRKGTRFSEIRTLFETGITVLSIAEPLKSCYIDADAREIARLLDKLDFEVAGVKESEKSKVIGYVAKSELKDTRIRDYIKDISQREIISESTPLVDLFTILSERPFVFILVGTEIKGIITKADINKPPVRIYLFSLVSLLEMHMSYWIKQSYRSDEWQKVLGKKRIAEANKTLEERKAKNQDLELIDCLQFCDKRDLVIKDENIRIHFQFESKTKAIELLKRAEKIRNTLAHSQNEITVGFKWEVFLKILGQIERSISSSDQAIDKMTEEVRNSPREELH